MKRVVLVFAVVLFSSGLFSQKNEFGFLIGGTYYVGELNPYKQYNQTHLGCGLLFRKNLNSRLSIRLSGNYGKVSGADSLNDLEIYSNRNLHFKSSLFELGGIVELNFFNYKPGDIKKDRYTPYLFTGLTYFYMNPMAQLGDDWYDLQSLGTEGQGSPLNSKDHYKLNQISMPFGIGYKANLTKRICISFEYGLRKTFTDYLDDVSGYYVNNADLREENGVIAAYFADRSIKQEGINGTNEGSMRGNPDNKDWYSFSGVIISFVLGKETGCYEFKKR